MDTLLMSVAPKHAKDVRAKQMMTASGITSRDILKNANL